MASIHPNWLIHHHEGDENAALVKKAKEGASPVRQPVERAVKPRPETREKPAKGKRR